MSKKIPWFMPEVGEKEAEYLSAVIASNYINDGDKARDFEQQIAEMVGAKYCVFVTSGTIALSLALMAHDIGFGDEVIVPDFTFIATANAARMTGANVVLVDIEPHKFTMCPSAVENAITDKTKAIIPVEVNGRAPDYSALSAICKKHNLIMITDSAEAIGSSWHGKKMGCFGNAGTFSFSPNKTITTGQGGMIMTDDEAVYFRLRELKDQGRRYTGTGGNDLHPVMGYNFKATNLQAAVGLAQLTLLEQRLEHARNREAWYRKHFRASSTLYLGPAPEHGEVLQWNDALADNRDEVCKLLKEQQIDSRPFWYPLHTQTPYLVEAYREEKFKNSIAASKKGFWLPSSFSLTEEDVARVCEALTKIEMVA